MDHRKTKTLVLALVFSLIFLVPLSLQAETWEPEGVLEREGIPFLEAYTDNPPVSGESPVTGLIWQGIYAPVLVVIDNAENAHPHWGVKDADVLYQMPNAGQGATKLLALFSDTAPAAAGGSRSARPPFVDAAIGWGAAFAYAGSPGEDVADRANVPLKLRQAGMRRNVLAFDLLSNNDYSERISGYQGGHNLSVNIARIRELALQNGAAFSPRPFLFADTEPEGYASVSRIEARHYGETAGQGDGNPASFSSFTYDAGANAWHRENAVGLYVDRDAPEIPIPFANVIIQRVKLTYASGVILTDHAVGRGAADIFIGGRYIPGGWYRSSPDSRTVFVDEKGEEIRLMRGKTFIIMTNDVTRVSVSP